MQIILIDHFNAKIKNNLAAKIISKAYFEIRFNKFVFCQSENGCPFFSKTGVGTGQSQIPQILDLSPGPRFPGPGLRDPGDPVPDADLCSKIA